MTYNEIYSIVIGILLGCSIYYSINYTNYHGPNSNVFRHKIFEHKGKCYKFNPKIHICPQNVKNMKF